MNTREGSLPLALPSDRETIEVALYSFLAARSACVCRIRNTASLDQFWVSAGLLNEVKENSHLEVTAHSAPLDFNDNGNLF